MRKTSSFSMLGAVFTLSLLSACGSATETIPPDTSSSSSTSSAMALTSASGSAMWDGKLLTGKHTVILATNKGDITLELDATMAPKTVTNFVVLANSKYYDGVTFHRVIPGFMIQGGDPTGNGTGGRSIFGEMFEDEIKADSPAYLGGYKAGTIAMANRGPNTNGSQFFIMDKNYPLPANYTIFGTVTSGLDIVHAIAQVDRDPNDMPKQKITFTVKVVN